MFQKDIILSLIAIVAIGLVIFAIVKIAEKRTVAPSAEEGEVITQGGFLPFEPVVWDNPESPHQSPLLEESEVPKGAIKLEVGTEKGFVPSALEVQKGEKVILGLTSKDRWSHIFKFKDASLSEVMIGVGPGQTRIITFYAPNRTGDYEFFCDMPRHEGRGEKGAMRVK